MKRKRTSLKKLLRSALRALEAYDLLISGLLQAYIDQGEWIKKHMQKTCNTCADQKTCEYCPKWGEPVRWNCPHYKGGDEA